MTRPIYTAPILMSAPLVLALLRGARGEPGGKTVTRRFPAKAWDVLERQFQAGDDCRLWVREAWHAARSHDLDPPRKIARDATIEHAATARSYAEIDLKGKLRPSIHMPRQASRLTLLDVTVRRERLGDISEEDAQAEGIEPYRGPLRWVRWLDAVTGNAEYHTALGAYIALWDHLYGPGAWDRDQDREVMVIGFRPVLANIDALGAGEAA